MKVVISLYLENAIILAAGASRRLGQPKALIEVNGKTLIEILITKLKKFNLNIIIVTRPDLEEKIRTFGEKIIINTEPDRGRTGSIQCGLRELNGQSCLIVPVDRPGFSDKTIKKLLEAKTTSCPSKNGKGGHPVVLIREDCKKILLSEPSTPLRNIINPLKIEVDDDFLHLNIDFPEDIDKLRNMIINNN
tara:strand:+ start:32 stop:604 length:573 start_codon:yes stop_codon:yes gene_type:complete